MRIDLSGRCILIVEDVALIAMDIADRLKSAQASVLIAATLRDGMRLAEHAGLSAAILDLALGDDVAVALCKRLTERGVPFIIHTGLSGIPNGCLPNAIVQKPADSGALLRALAQVLM
jgi:DNA-binding response OmpR family regulator